MTRGSFDPVALERFRGAAGEFHGRDFPLSPIAQMWWFEVGQPAIALGSRQHAELLDLDRCASSNVEIVRRRSGGGLVYLQPDAIIWVDVLIPVSDPRYRADVRDSMVWMGRCWADALDRLGCGPDLEVHRTAERRTAWSELICFAGVGPGEVLRGGHKLVGISQRRTRWGSRFQCALHRDYEPERFLPLVRATTPSRAELPPVAHLDADLATTEVIGALEAAVTASSTR